MENNKTTLPDFMQPKDQDAWGPRVSLNNYRQTQSTSILNPHGNLMEGADNGVYDEKSNKPRDFIQSGAGFQGAANAITPQTPGNSEKNYSMPNAGVKVSLGNENAPGLVSPYGSAGDISYHNPVTDAAQSYFPPVPSKQDRLNALALQQAEEERKRADEERQQAAEGRQKGAEIQARRALMERDARQMEANKRNSGMVRDWMARGAGVIDPMMTTFAGAVRPFNDRLADTLRDAGQTASLYQGKNSNFDQSVGSKIIDGSAKEVSSGLASRYGGPVGNAIISGLQKFETEYEKRRDAQDARFQNNIAGEPQINQAVPNSRDAKLGAVLPAARVALESFAGQKIGQYAGGMVENQTNRPLAKLGADSLVNEATSRLQSAFDNYLDTGSWNWEKARPDYDTYAGSFTNALLGVRKGKSVDGNPNESAGESAREAAAVPPFSMDGSAERAYGKGLQGQMDKIQALKVKRKEILEQSLQKTSNPDQDAFNQLRLKQLDDILSGAEGGAP